MSRNDLQLGLAIAGAVVLLTVKQAVVGDARWWNLVMAGLLTAVLIAYLRGQRRGS